MSEDREIAKIVEELEKGEKAAQMLETKLSSLESKIDDLLSSCQETNLMTAELNDISLPIGPEKKEEVHEEKNSNEKKAEDPIQK
ncbi:hypothetical protein OnM2_024032 [Erysiphe neolycopersici]|uniref:Uncharacterized protein n=1 Tax=Erysiphe neolycopersici TaxID=212602 RepID=A0A420I1V7_9PEZI|nr:hypothetical protein OnM2_024032 [Erysiphe neolycopersici]